MALQTQFLTSFTTKLHHSFSPIFTIKSENSSQPSDSISKNKPGVGFGSSNENSKRKRKGKRERDSSITRRNPVDKTGFGSETVQESITGKRITRRNPVQKPDFGSVQEPVEESSLEKGFVLAWLGFGSVILVEGIALAASGFLPEKWDKLFVKYLYPSFTPTVFLFFAGAVAFGAVKYKQNEKLTERK